MLAVLHGLARFVDMPGSRADVDLVAREWAATAAEDDGVGSAAYPGQSPNSLPAALPTDFS
jgi:hypothetical protein